MFYSYKNTKLALNNREFLISEASIGIQSESSPKYLDGNRHSFEYSPENGIGGSLSLTYYITGQDYLKDYLTEEQTVISGYFGGLFFKSGYLSNYSLKGSPNRPISINAEIIFFDELNGKFNPTYETQAEEINPLNFSDSRFVIANGNTAGNEITDIISLDYVFSSEILPVYTTNGITPERIAFGPKSINLNLQTSLLSGDLPISGKNAGITINLYSNDKTTLKESFAVDGNLFQRNININIGQILSSTIGIKQNYVDIAPTINSFTPLSGYQGQGVLISGNDFTNTISVVFNDLESIFTVLDDNRITGNIPYGAISGPIKIKNFGGTQSTSNNFIVLQSGIVVNDIIPITGNIDETITISGDNFYRINKVLFGEGEALFNTINNNIILAQVPNTANWGQVTVFSDIRNITGVSNRKFVPIPIIEGFTAVSGVSGDSITISGKAFSGINYVSFNNLSSSFTVNNNYQITAIVPSGNTKGAIRISGQSGVRATSPYDFNPIVKITGISPNSSLTGAAINIFGLNFYDNLMYPVDDKFLVSFVNGTGAFTRINDTQLSGYVPYDAETGPVYIHAPDFSKYPNTGDFTLIYGNPVITNLQPSSGKYNDFITINGRNLINVTGVIISGNTGASIINNYSVSNFSNFISAQLPNVTGGKYDIIIRTIYGAVTGDDLLTILDKPIISGFTPNSGFAGSRVILSGKNIYPISKIYIDNTGIPAGIDTGSFNSFDNHIEFFIPQNAPSSGNIILFNSVDYATGSFFTKFNSQIISGFTPLTGEIGSSVVISGNNFNIVNQVFIGENPVTSYTFESPTGIRFNIPDNSLTDYIILGSPAGEVSSNDKLFVLSPAITISGFTPTGAFQNDKVIISGRNFNTILEIAVSGQNEEILIFANDFTYQSNTGVEFLIPFNTIDGKIKVTNPRDSYFTSDILHIITPPLIDNISPLSGYFNQTISISGSGLAGREFYFSSPTGQLIKSLSTTIIGDTGASITVPREIIQGNLSISGNGRILNVSNPIFTPIPTISGFLPTGLMTGSIITITGLNSFQAFTGFLGISGANDTFAIICDNLSGDYSRITGGGITTSETGYSIFSGSINNTFAGTGKLFLINQFDNEIFNTYYLLNNNILSNQIVSISPGAPIIYGFTPMSGGSGTSVNLSGGALNNVTGLYFISGANRESGFILNKEYGNISFNPPTGSAFYPRTSGQIQLISPYGTTNSIEYFSVLNIPRISGFTPSQGNTGVNVRITGFGLENVTELYFGNTLANFTTHLIGGNWELTGIVPNPQIIPQSVYIVALNPAGSGISNSRFTISEGGSSTQTTILTATSLALGGLKTIAHGFPGIPQSIRVVLVNETTDCDWVPGDEVGIEAFSGDSFYAAAAIYVDGTNINIRFTDSSGFVPNKTTGNIEPYTIGNWSLKIYVTYFS